MRPTESNVSADARRARKKVVQDICLKIINCEMSVVSESLLIYLWLARYMVNGSMWRMKLEKIDNDIDTAATINNNETVITRKGGCP